LVGVKLPASTATERQMLDAMTHRVPSGCRARSVEPQ